MRTTRQFTRVQPGSASAATETPQRRPRASQPAAWTARVPATTGPASSPRVAAQRVQLQAMFGAASERVAGPEQDNLQTKARPVAGRQQQRPQADVGPGSVVQRAVGFEFQTGWGVEQKTTLGRKTLPKGRVLHSYGQFQATADEQTGTAVGAELEWVVDPPIQESAGLKAVTTVMGQMNEAVNSLLAFKDQTTFFLNEATGSEADKKFRVYPTIAGANAKSMPANAQATVGVGMAHLMRLFEELGQEEPADEQHKDTVGVLTAKTGIDPFKRAVKVGRSIAGTERLKGLVAFVSRYLDMGAADPQMGVRYSLALEYAKASTLILARTDFAQMFSMLPEWERKEYAGAPDAFVALVLDAQGDKLDPDGLVLARGIKGKPDKKVKGTGEILYPILTTRKQWLTEITQGSDLLSSKARPEKSQALESMGSLGSKTDARSDKNPSGGVGEEGKHRGVVMELRETKQQMPASQWQAYAEGVFAFIEALNRRKIVGGSKAHKKKGQ